MVQRVLILLSVKRIGLLFFLVLQVLWRAMEYLRNLEAWLERASEHFRRFHVQRL
jgi:hypothetical protein